MISTEISRRYPFFAGLSLDRINTLAKVARGEKVEAGHFFMNIEFLAYLAGETGGK